MTNSETIEKLKEIWTIFDYTLVQKESTDCIELTIKALEENEQLKAEIARLKEKEVAFRKYKCETYKLYPCDSYGSGCRDCGAWKDLME